MLVSRPIKLVAFRELRKGKRTFALSVITTSLAAAMLFAVLGLGDALRQTLASDATVILGGDFEARISSRDFSAEERDWLVENSDRTSSVTTVRSAAFTDDLSALMVIRAIDSNYPLFGEVEMQGDLPYSHDMLTQPSGDLVPVVVSSDLGDALEVGVGDTFLIGSATVVVTGLASRIPDPSATMLLNAPIVYMDHSSLPKTGLGQFGALRSARMKIDIGDRDKQVWRQEARDGFPESSWRIRGTDRVVPGIQEMINRMETMMMLVSLGTMLISGICVGSSVSTFLRARMTSIAVLKSLGMPSAQIRASYLIVSLLFVVIGSVIGLPIGFLAEKTIIELLSGRLPFEIVTGFSITNLLVVPAVAIFTAWIFTVRPLRTFASVSPTSLFSLSAGHTQDVAKLGKQGLAEMAVPTVALLVLLVVIAGDRLFLVLFAAGGAAAAWMFKFFADMMVKTAAKARPRDAATKIAMRSVARSGGQVGAAAASLGVGLSTLLTFSLTEANFENRLNETLANKTPEYYLVGMQPGDAEKIRAATTEWLPNPEDLVELPMMRGSVTHLNHVPVEEIDAPEDVDWIIESERRFTWAKDQTTQWTGSSKVSEGEEWDTSEDRLLVSFDAEAADAFGLSIGDPIGFRVDDVEHELTIANLRSIDWSTFDVNFAMVLSDGPWSKLPHGYLGSVRDLVGNHHKFQREVIKVAPSITPIRTKTIIESVTGLLRRIGVLLNMVTLTATVSGVLVLAAAIAEGKHRREHDSIVLRMLGTPHETLSKAFRIEFIAIACLASIPALGVAMTASYLITDLLLELPWSLDWVNAALVLAATTMTVMVMGSASTARLVRTPPLTLLRNE